MLKVKTIGQDVYAADELVPNLTSSDIDRLKKGVEQTARQRARLCTHPGIEDNLHEMFVTYVKATYVKANKHIGKDESLHILEGAADFVFFDDEGQIIDVVPLGTYESGRNFYCRIPHSVYHTWVIHSDVIVVHETTPGPFDRQDTIWAPWAPDEDDPAVQPFMERLTVTAAAFLAGVKTR